MALVVWGLYLIDALYRHLELGVDAGPDVERAAGQLAACIFAMFLFRRWYLFASLGLVIGLGVELAWLAFSRRGRFPWRAATILAGFAGSIFLVLASPVILDWLPEWKSHDYASMYAGYNYGATEFVRHMPGTDMESWRWR